jgi:putative multiple sugar transport system ATP-binding protein
VAGNGRAPGASILSSPSEATEYPQTTTSKEAGSQMTDKVDAPHNDAPLDDAPLNILEMRGITKTFPGVKALQDVTIKVGRGEVHAICGENGAGKSTLMKVLSGVYPFGSYDGDIVFENKTVEFKDIRDSEAEGIVIIHQELALSPYLSIAENIFLNNEQRGGLGLIDWNKTNAEAAKLLARVGLRENPTTKIMDLGVGKQQLVEIAKALSKRVKLLILDEPTAALNDEDSDHLLNLILHLKEQGITAIIISHKLNEIKKVADAVTVIRDGKTIETIKKTDVTEERIIKDMVGRDLEHRYPDHTPHIGDEILRVEDWTAHHPQDANRVMVDNVNINVRRGEIVGIAGLMGAGRTEFAMSLFGRSYGARISGRVFKNGKEIKTRTVSEAIGNGLAYATEDRKTYGLNLIDDIKRNISMAALKKLERLGLVDDGQEWTVANEYRKSMNIKSPTVLAKTGKLSGGNQQKVVLSKWIYSDPDVLILDEPTRGIDVGAKYEIYSIINRLAAEGKGVIVISSELPELLGICDRIYALSEGRITGELPIEEASPEALLKLMTMEKAR